MLLLEVLVDGPLAGVFPYRPPEDAPAPRTGDWLVVPWGKSRRIALCSADPQARPLRPDDPPLDRIRAVLAVQTGLPRVGQPWLEFIRAAGTYYHAPPAELALGSLPKLLKPPPGKRHRDAADRLADFGRSAREGANPPAVHASPRLLHPHQQQALTHLLDISASSPDPPAPRLLHGATGSGKTEVYLRWIDALLAGDPQAQVLLLVPEIGLTPQLAQQLRQRFPQHPLAVLHSNMGDARRASHWLAAASGQARIVLGTRLAVLCPMPGLRAIIVDEEHDPSFKQQEGVRYSARDLAVMRANIARCPVLLGSATPSFESWRNAQSGRYVLLSMPERVSGGSLPAIEIIERQRQRSDERGHGLGEPVIAALGDVIARKRQALLFLNRRGYAPVLSCGSCGWLSRCGHCDAWRVLHRMRPSSTAARGPSSAAAGGPAGSPSARHIQRPSPPPTQRPSPSPAPRHLLACHHCGEQTPVPRACPECGDQDLVPVGRGTQRLEEGLAELFPSARIARLDRDVAARRGATERFMDAAHAGETDLMIGTQMLAKGHDFQRLDLVVVVDADAGLFASDFRAPERLFATLMQVAGRAGRHSQTARTLIQTRYPDHPIFEHLKRHDYVSFATAQLEERESVGLPPFSHQALLTAQARDMDTAIAFLSEAAAHLNTLAASGRPTDPPTCTVCDPVPMPLALLRGVSRAQLLVESASRPRLHRLLRAARPRVDQIAHGMRGRMSWQLVIDPLDI